MVATTTDQIYGVETSKAVKVPCRVATTGNITLSGEQTIDGVAVVADDRVLVRQQSSGVDNGIWVCAIGVWSRAEDFNGQRDVVSGTRVLVAQGSTYTGHEFRLTNAGAITIGTTALTFADMTVVGSGEITDGAIVDADVNASAAIAGTKLAFVQAGANAVTQTVQAKLREGFVVSPEDYGADGTAAGDTTALTRALSAIQTNGSGTLKLSRHYLVNAALTITGVPITIQGEGSGRAALVDTAVAASAYVLSISNSDYTDGVTLRGFSILTTKTTPDSYGLFVEFSQNDATFNRAPIRFVMEDMDIRGRDLDGSGFVSQGFLKGVRLEDVIRPRISRVDISGKQTSFAAAGMSTMAIGWELVQTGASTVAPTDASFTDCQVYAADVAWSITGHWEGILYDRSIGVGTNEGINWASGSSYPWLSVQNCHFNCFEDIITTTGVFDVKILNCLLYKWYFPTVAGLVNSKAINIQAAFRSTIIGNTFYNNPADAGETVVFDAVNLTDTGAALVSANVMNRIRYGLTLNGASDNLTYQSGVWYNPFGSGAVEYQNLGSGTAIVVYRGGGSVIENNFTIQLIDAGAGEGPPLILDRSSASPAANDLIGYIPFAGRDSGANVHTYAKLSAQITDTTNGSEDGDLIGIVSVNGTLTERWRAKAVGVDITGVLAVSGGISSRDTAAAGASFDASTGTPTNIRTINITSITDNGVGDWTFNLTAAIASADPILLGGGYRDSGALGGVPIKVVRNINRTQTTTAIQIWGHRGDTGAAVDGFRLGWAAFVGV